MFHFTDYIQLGVYPWLKTEMCSKKKIIFEVDNEYAVNRSSE